MNLLNKKKEETVVSEETKTEIKQVINNNSEKEKLLSEKVEVASKPLNVLIPRQNIEVKPENLSKFLYFLKVLGLSHGDITREPFFPKGVKNGEGVIDGLFADFKK